MSKKKEEVQKMFNVHVCIDNNRFEITDDKFNALVRLDQNQVRSIIEVISYMIDEDIPGMIEKGKWNKDKWGIEINCELPLEDMLDNE